MSTRRFRQSSKHGAPYVIDMNEPISHWSRQWVSPNLPRQQPQGLQPPVLPPSIAPSANGTPHEGTDTPKDGASIFQFQVKTWVQIEDHEHEPLEDGDYDDALDLLSSTAGQRLQKEEPSQGGLTAADIRGAVGGEAIPGIVAEYKGEDGEEIKENGKDKVQEQEIEKDTDVVMTEQSAEDVPQEPAVLPVAEIINPTVVAASNEQSQADPVEEKEDQQADKVPSPLPAPVESTTEITEEIATTDSPKVDEAVLESTVAKDSVQSDEKVETEVSPSTLVKPESEPVPEVSVEQQVPQTALQADSNTEKAAEEKKDEQGDVAMEEAPES